MVKSEILMQNRWRRLIGHRCSDQPILSKPCSPYAPCIFCKSLVLKPSLPSLSVRTLKKALRCQSWIKLLPYLRQLLTESADTRSLSAAVVHNRCVGEAGVHVHGARGTRRKLTRVGRRCMSWWAPCVCTTVHIGLHKWANRMNVNGAHLWKLSWTIRKEAGNVLSRSPNMNLSVFMFFEKKLVMCSAAV